VLLSSNKTQAYRAKAPLGSAKKASCEAEIASCEDRTTAAPSGAKASCEASAALSKAKTTAFLPF